MKHGNYQKYMNPNPLQRLLIRRFLDTVARWIEELNVRLILDVGCAEGFVSAYVLDRCPWVRAFGVDIDVSALRRGRMLGHTLPTCAGDVISLPMASGMADVVMATEVLEHVPEPERAVRELVRASREYVLISVPWEPWFRVANALRLKNLSRLGDDPEHVNHWTGRGFRRFLSPYGRILVHQFVFPWQLVLLEK